MKTMPRTLPQFFIRFLSPYTLELIGQFFVAILWAVQLSLSPVLMKMLIDTAERCADTPEKLFPAIAWSALFYIALFALEVLIYRFHDVLMIRMMPELQANVTVSLFDYLEGHSYRYFQEQLTGNLAGKVADLTKAVERLLAGIVDIFFSYFIALLIAIVTLYWTQAVFGWFMIVWSFCYITGTLFFAKKAQALSEKASHAGNMVTGRIADSISNILNVKLFAQESYEHVYLQDSLKERVATERTLSRFLMKLKFGQGILTVIFFASIVWALLVARSKNLVTLGDFALVLGLALSCVNTVWHISHELLQFLKHLGVAKQALKAVSKAHEVTDVADAKALKVTGGQIEFKEVYFYYPKGNQVFANKSLFIPAGQKLGLVGASGSGKSTLVSLIMRFFDIQSGKILIDGQDISQVTQASLRNSIAMIPQDPLLFHRTILENIRYGRKEATDAEVIQASIMAHCHDFIIRLKEGYYTHVGERGVKLSGGQRQRIAIARAIVKNAPILILDEATSALDSVTEKYIQESLAYLMKHKTTIVIAHRLSTLVHLDRILVFHHGRIIEQGSHEVLLKKRGHYARLWELQAGSTILQDSA